MRDGRVGYCAVRRRRADASAAAREVAIATREAQLGDDLAALEASVLARFRAEAEAERTGARRRHAAADAGDPPHRRGAAPEPASRSSAP